MAEQTGRQKRMAGTINPLSPGTSLLCKLGSIIVHAEEGRGADGHHFDWAAVSALLADHEVEAWMAAMRKLALLPVKRDAKSAVQQSLSRRRRCGAVSDLVE